MHKLKVVKFTEAELNNPKSYIRRNARLYDEINIAFYDESNKRYVVWLRADPKRFEMFNMVVQPNQVIDLGPLSEYMKIQKLDLQELNTELEQFDSKEIYSQRLSVEELNDREDFDISDLRKKLIQCTLALNSAETIINEVINKFYEMYNDIHSDSPLAEQPVAVVDPAISGEAFYTFGEIPRLRADDNGALSTTWIKTMLKEVKQDTDDE